MRDESEMEAGCRMTEILIAGCVMKIGWDMLRFVGGIGDRTAR